VLDQADAAERRERRDFVETGLGLRAVIAPQPSVPRVVGTRFVLRTACAIAVVARCASATSDPRGAAR